MARHRHQVSLENILDFSPPLSLSPQQRSNASRRFYQITNHFDINEEIPPGWGVSCNRPRLIKLIYEYALSEESKDLLLRAFFQALRLNLDDVEDVIIEGREDELRLDVIGFAEYLMDNFFLPLKAATQKTPQPSPVCHSAVLMVQGNNQEYKTTPTRIAALRGTSLIRDRHRCVISRVFDLEEAQKRRKTMDIANAQDDDGNQLSGPLGYLEVAHIIPHSVMRPQGSSQSRQAALAILNMFDIGIARLIEGVEIDRPFNTLSLRPEYHRHFGAFELFFTELLDQEPHTYKIETFEGAIFDGLGLSFPLIRTLLLSPDRNIDPPSSRLLAIHRAIAHILHFSGAGEYIDRLLRDMDNGFVQNDGSTELDRFVRLHLRELGDDRVSAH